MIEKAEPAAGLYPRHPFDKLRAGWGASKDWKVEQGPFPMIGIRRRGKNQR